MYKFKVISSDIHEFKMYGISPDNNHTYIIIKRFISQNDYCAITGQFIIMPDAVRVIEYEPMVFSELTQKEYQILKQMITKLPTWDPIIMNSIVGFSTNKSSEDLLF